jgi:hypothetical protein
MATKRMFDKSILETDNFLNISLGAKALYFLLGMEADDEGFVSPNRIIRLYGGEYGDLKNLIDSGLVIPFNSGVVVITDWRQNNWLDSRRIKPTQYQEEKRQLTLNSQNKYLLSNGLASREERSRVESSREEIKVIENKEIELPEWINREVWSRWEKYRKDIKKKMTPLTVKQQIKFLSEHKENYEMIINNSIQNGWTGLFPLKGDNKKTEVYRNDGKQSIAEKLKSQVIK